MKLNKKVSPEVLSAVSNIEDYSKLADTVASHLAVRIPEKQEILALTRRRAPGEGAWDDGERDLRPAGGEAHPLARQAPDGEDAARVHLNEQMKAIQKELGDGEDGRDEMRELEERIAKTNSPRSAREGRDGAEEAASDEPDVGRSHGRAQLSRLAARPAVEEAVEGPQRPDFAEEVLNADHYGLDKVKERIVEYLAVQSRANKLKGPILCLVGPPASARRRSASRSPRRPAASSCACRWAASATRPRSAATGAPISARCPAR